jgi:glycine cleavage system T protein (aminomethyltransferase)
MSRMSEQAKKSTFYDFLSRYAGTDFDTYMASSVEDEDYLNWNGHTLPYVFVDAEQEYNAVRSGCALFDATPARKYRIRGADAGAFMDYLVTRSMTSLPTMRATYGIWCNEDGMLNDDSMLYKLAEDHYLVMVAEVDHGELFARIAERFNDVSVIDDSASLAGLAVQGAKSCAVLQSFGFDGIENLKPFHVQRFTLADGEVMVSRVGFTGDLGYEIWFDPELRAAVEVAFLAAEEALGIKIAGYGLTTIQLCRMEAGMIVPGWDTAQTFEDPEFERSPFELGMAWNVDLERAEDFLGKSALLEERANGSRFAMKGFAIDADCELEDGAELFAEIDGEAVQVGTLPSVSWSHSAKGWIGLASLRTAHAHISDGYVEIGETSFPCRIVDLPFINLERRRQVPAPL